MPSYVSHGGDWKAAQERAVNIKTGELYQGPDREAMKEIEKAGGKMGRKAEEDPENIMKARQLGMSVQEFLELGAPPKEEQEKALEENKAKVVDNNKGKEPPRQRPTRPQPGATTMEGGFGEQPSV